MPPSSDASLLSPVSSHASALGLSGTYKENMHVEYDGIVLTSNVPQHLNDTKSEQKQQLLNKQMRS